MADKKSYSLTRISDDVHVKDNGQPHLWDKYPTKLYSGTVTFASEILVESVNQLEMDIRVLLESGKIEVIGRAPVFEGLHILHDLEAQEFIQKRIGSKDDLELHAKLMSYRTVFVVLYTAGMVILDESDYTLRLDALKDYIE